MILTIMMTGAFFIMCGLCIKIIYEKKNIERKLEYICNQYNGLVKIIKSHNKTERERINGALWHIDNIPF